MKKIIILMAVLFLTTGCFDYQELNNTNVVTGIGFDMVDDEYSISLEVTKSENSKDGEQKKATIFSAKDSNLGEAITKAINMSDKEAYLKHVDVVLISEEIAKEGISPIVDYLLRETNMSTTFFIAICENANELLSLKFDNDTTSKMIVSTITSHLDVGMLNNVDIITSNILNKRKDIALPFVQMEDEKKLLIEDKAYFFEDKMVDTISNKIYNFLNLNSKNTVFMEDNNVLNIYDKKISYNISKDLIIVNVTGKGKIISLNENVDLNKRNSYVELEKMINKKIKEEIEDFLNETLANNADLVGFKDLYYKKYMKEIDSIPYKVKVNITVARNGTLMEVIHD